VAGPLDGLRVLDLSSGPAGGLATMMLADFGADVIKVEPPEGDPQRALPNSPMWLRGKRSAVLDLGRSEDREHLHDLAKTVDVVVATYEPGEAEGLTADAATLRGLNPALVYCSITGWGTKGPYAHYPVDEHLIHAKSGRMLSMQGIPPRDGPAYSAVQVATHGTAHGALQGIIAALIARDRTGEGQVVETSLLHGLLPYDMGGLIREQLAARDPGAYGADPLAERGRMPTLNYHPILAKDGRWIQLGNLLEHLFYSYVAAADLTEIIIDDRFQGPPASWSNEDREYARDLMLTRMQERTADEWMQAFHENGNVAAEIFTTTQGGLANTDLRANDEIAEVDHPRLGRLTQLGLVGRLTETPGEVGGPDPLVGEHTAEVLAELGAPRRSQVNEGRAADAPKSPLEGVTIVELSTIIATPLAASLLADLGARVIKVEPIGGDPYRVLGAGAAAGIGAAKTNTGKESICVDLKSAEGRAIMDAILAKADVVMHNYRPGVPERLGIGFEDAKRHNPRIVYVSANGYGPDGPSALRPCAHPIPGAGVGGALFQAGAGQPPEHYESLADVRETARRLMRANEVNPDPNTSMVIASAVVFGLYAAKRLGVGQQVFTDMMLANMYANHDDALSYEGKAPRPTLDADCYGIGPTVRLYEAASGWVFLAVRTQEAWENFCAAAARDDLAADPRFSTPDAREQNADALASELASLFATDDADAWERRLIPAGIGCVRADGASVGQFWASDPHVLANGMNPEVAHATWGTYRRHGPVVTFDRMPREYDGACLGGEHTDALLAEIGYDEATIADFRARNIVGSIST